MQKILAIIVLLIFGVLAGMSALNAAQNDDSPASVEKAAAQPQPQRQNEELAARMDAAEVLWLKDPTGEFLGLYQSDRSGLALGAALLIPDQANHPDWPQTIGPLRRQLPDHGWNTLAIALPPLQEPPVLRMPIKINSAQPDAQENSANPSTEKAPVPTGDNRDQTLARIDAGIKHLEQTGNRRLAIIGTGTGGYWAAIYLQQNPEIRAGLIVIGARPPAQATGNLTQIIAQLPRPVLDLYYEGGQASVRERISRTRSNPKANYQQNLMVQPRDHWLEKNSSLMRRIKGWAKRNL